MVLFNRNRSKAEHTIQTLNQETGNHITILEIEMEPKCFGNFTLFCLPFTSEIEGAERTLKGYKIVFQAVPVLIIIAALLPLFMHMPTWRAMSITNIALLFVI